MKYFLDTGFLIALANKDDKYHKFAADRFSEITDTDDFIFITSDHVVSEFLTFIERNVTFQEAITWGVEFFERKLFEIIVSTESNLVAAWNIYKNQENDKKILTFVDCIILETALVTRTDELLSYDGKLMNLFNSRNS